MRLHGLKRTFGKVERFYRFFVPLTSRQSLLGEATEQTNKQLPVHRLNESNKPFLSHFHFLYPAGEPRFRETEDRQTMKRKQF